ncbi:MAG: hypothetical protein HYZ42_01425 [Bacteroidetes bacterium]|nr:hypothetical protein [Bacteroidota bacterium]
MREKRPIKPEEVVLIQYMLFQKNLNPADYKIAEMVDEYEDGKMGSIGMGDETATYDGDIAQAEYKDSDGVDVVITLTHDTNNQILDLDFWKVDFSKLLVYPTPDDLVFLK